MTTADLPQTDRKTAHPRGRPSLGSGSLIALVLLLAGIAATTTYRSDSEDRTSGKAAFDASKYAAGTYEPKVVPAIEKNAVDIVTLHKAIAADPETAGKRYGHRPGTGPYSYATTVTGTAGAAENGLLRVTVPGLAKARVSVQVGPAVNGTALRDSAGFITFGQFTNQVEYADAATALNTEMKDKVLRAFDPEAVRGRKVTVVGAMTPLTADVLTLTPVSIEAAS
ncbi:DUF2291 family protein [Streptomyces sp. NPDC058665]|uniref:DUF2291 family protein n=1 Tax=Streptomyces sp. NPDC058665 TaxID=3346586 RepID=UPI00365756FA